jgi:hypothetical protein
MESTEGISDSLYARFIISNIISYCFKFSFESNKVPDYSSNDLIHWITGRSMLCRILNFQPVGIVATL